MDWTDSGCTRKGGAVALDQLWTKRFLPVLEIMGVEPAGDFSPREELAGQVFDTINRRPFNTFPEKYRWQED